MPEPTSGEPYAVRLLDGPKSYVFDPDVVRPVTPREAVLLAAAFMGVNAQNARPGWIQEFLAHHDLWRHFRQEA